MSFLGLNLPAVSVPGRKLVEGAFLLAFEDGQSKMSWQSFQYYPETVSDNRSVSLEDKYGLGGSHPIYQWTRGSAREIAFDAVFSADYATPAINNATSSKDKFETIRSFVKSPAYATYSLFVSEESRATEKHQTNIIEAVKWLRQFTYPTYAQSRAQAPKRLLLNLPNSGINHFGDPKNPDTLVVLMTRCDVVYEAFFANGVPRIATVSLQFVETIQHGNWKYQSAGKSAYKGPKSKS